MSLPEERIQNRIYFIRGHKVMLDRDLAVLYGIQTKVLNQAVRRNIERFPDDFMFELTLNEAANLKSQIVTSSYEHGGRRKPTRAFTELGVAMLSSVLNSPEAIAVNIQIMRTFSRLRQMLVENEELRRKLEALECQYDKQFRIIFDAIHRLLDEEAVETPEIGFKMS